MNVPVIPTLTVPPIEAAGEAILALLIGRYIESSGTPAQQLAKAQQLLGFDVALEEINAGNTAGVADLQTAVQNWVATLTKDPAAQLAWNELAATVTTGLAALESTIIGKLDRRDRERLHHAGRRGVPVLRDDAECGGEVGVREAGT